MPVERVVRFNIQDGKKNGHNLYVVKDDFFGKYKQIT